MDLLIHLIIWIFRTLFGEQEPPAKLGPGSSSSSDGRRGPYNYGDDRSSANPPKTLAELLEEARRQSGGGRQGGSQAQSRPQPPPQPQYQPKPQTQFVKPLPPTSLQPTVAQASVMQAQPQGKKGKKRKAAADQQAPMSAQAIAAQAMAAQTAARGTHRIGLNSGPRTMRARQLMPLFGALRKGKKANPALLAAQAMVLKEVFGPPRALDPYRGGRQAR